MLLHCKDSTVTHSINRMVHLVINCTASSAEVCWTLPTSKVQAASSGKVIAAVALGALCSQRMDDKFHCLAMIPQILAVNTNTYMPFRKQYLYSLTYSILLQEGGQALLLIPLIIFCLPPCELIAGDPSVLVLPLEGIQTRFYV